MLLTNGKLFNLEYHIVPALIAAGATLAGGLMSAWSNKKTNDANISAQERANEQNIAFQREENQIAREREDNAVRRRLADVQAAGFSPLAAIGNGAGSAAMTAPTVSAAQQNPTDFSFMGDAANNAISAYESSQARKMQQQIYDDAADTRAAELRQKVAAADSAESDALMKQMDALGYGKKLGLESETMEASLEDLKQSIKNKQRDADDRHEISELQKVGISRDNALKAQQIQLGSSTMADKIKQVKNATSLQEKQKLASDLANEFQQVVNNNARDDRNTKVALDDLAKQNGYKSYQHMLDVIESNAKERDFKQDQFFKSVDAGISVFEAAVKSIGGIFGIGNTKGNTKKK